MSENKDKMLKRLDIYYANLREIVEDDDVTNIEYAHLVTATEKLSSTVEDIIAFNMLTNSYEFDESEDKNE